MKNNQVVTLNVSGLAPVNNQKNIGEMTLNELFNDTDVEIIKTKKSLKLIKDTEENSIVFEMKKKEGLEITNHYKFHKTKDKSILQKTAKELYREGHTQKEIADILGMHQSQISLILRDKY